MPETIGAIASRVRAFLEPVWLVWHQAEPRPLPPVLSQHTCGRSSLFLRDALRLEGFQADWTNGIPRVSEEGPVIGDFGFYSGLRWESHAWVSCEGWIVDVTADQFGAAPVIVAPAPDPRYSPRPRDTTSPAAIGARQRAVARIWPAWLALRDARQSVSGLD